MQSVMLDSLVSWPWQHLRQMGGTVPGALVAEAGLGLGGPFALLLCIRIHFTRYFLVTMETISTLAGSA